MLICTLVFLNSMLSTTYIRDWASRLCSSLLCTLFVTTQGRRVLTPLVTFPSVLVVSRRGEMRTSWCLQRKFHRKLCLAILTDELKGASVARSPSFHKLLQTCQHKSLFIVACGVHRRHRQKLKCQVLEARAGDRSSRKNSCNSVERTAAR